MSQQTVVEMMLEYLQNHGFDMEYEMELSFIEWEKDQIAKAFNEGMLNSVDYFGNGVDEAEQYYNETYQSNQDKPYN